MTEQIKSPFRNPRVTRAAAVFAGAALTSLTFFRTEGTEPYNFDPAVLGSRNQFARATPEACTDKPSAVGVPLTKDPQTVYLGVRRSDDHFEDAIRVEGTSNSLTMTPMMGLERTIFAEEIPQGTVVQLPLEDDAMIVQIGRGPGAGSDERMVVAAGCNQDAIDKQLFFYEGQTIIHVPPMKEGH